MRIKSHESSTKYDCRGAPKVKLPRLHIGDRVYIKSDAEKNKACDPYVILSFVPNKNEVHFQKWGNDKNKQNVINFQIQNLYKVNPVDQETESHEEQFPTKSLQFSNENRKPIKKNGKCFYCVNMGRQNIYHSPCKCKDLNLIRPKPTRGVSSSESDSEIDDQPLWSKQIDMNKTIINNSLHDVNGNSTTDDTDEFVGVDLDNDSLPEQNSSNERNSVIQHGIYLADLFNVIFTKMTQDSYTQEMSLCTSQGISKLVKNGGCKLPFIP